MSRSFEETIKTFKASDGVSLYDHSDQAALLVVFLNFIGCTFCKRAIRDLAPVRRSLEQNGVRLLFVHMGTPDEGRKMIEDNGVPNPLHLSDPDRELYRVFELKRATFLQNNALRVWWTALMAFLFQGILPSKPSGDMRQMPGVFLVHKGVIENAYRHAYVSDRPDYLKLADCEFCTEEPAPQATR